MNEQIITNLYEFWKHIGKLTDKLTETDDYLAVSVNGSDWPNRIFNLKKDKDSIDEIQGLSQEEKLPDMITIAKPNNLKSYRGLDFVFVQKNMALDLRTITNKLSATENILRVVPGKDSGNFAKVASESFGYCVDYNVIDKIAAASDSVRLFIYQEDNECLGCGIIFFDSNNNAGLHMIGTIPKGRGKGLGKSMTERLLSEAKGANKKYCVLNASIMGEPIYRKLGFEPFGEIETYRIIKREATKD